MFKLKKFLLSNKNMAGLAGIGLIIILAFIGVLKSFWLPLAGLAYILGYMLGPKEQELKFIHVRNENYDHYIGFLGRLNNNVHEHKRLTPEAMKIIQNIVAIATELLVFLKEKNGVNFNEEMMDLTAIFDTYLPNLINEYERLPVRYATQIKTSSGKSANEMFIEQLTVLEQKITEISYGMYEDDVTALKVNGRFLKEKFNKKNIFEFELEINA